jgi:hypothetical protein
MNNPYFERMVEILRPDGQKIWVAESEVGVVPGIRLSQAFHELYNILAVSTPNPDLREVIAALRDSENIHEPLPGGWFHKAVLGTFTYIANFAQDLGDGATCRLAREMRDEIRPYIDLDAA